jgi:hypothetical protein
MLFFLQVVLHAVVEAVAIAATMTASSVAVIAVAKVVSIAEVIGAMVNVEGVSVAATVVVREENEGVIVGIGRIVHRVSPDLKEMESSAVVTKGLTITLRLELVRNSQADRSRITEEIAMGRLHSLLALVIFLSVDENYPIVMVVSGCFRVEAISFRFMVGILGVAEGLDAMRCVEQN